MSRLANTADGWSEVTNLRRRRDELQAKAHRLRFRRGVQRLLNEELQRTTTELLKRELEAKTKPEPLGDAGPVGDQIQPRLPYKD
ncbi:gas vesicle protein V [Roseibium sediminis]|uniref:gas vesicle protein V n=1 Tax=Roseibium sediminis TaxID=1775174 RepID=UPI00123DE843|nr:gas vesicle protein V [Roseibium sediminis]